MFSIWGVGTAASPYLPKSPERRLRVAPASRSLPARQHVAGDATSETSQRGASAGAPRHSKHAAAYEAASETHPKRRPAATAADLMSAPVITLASEASLRTAVALFREHRFRHVPVCEPSGMLVGILSDRDLLRDGVLADSALIAEVMTTPVLTAHPETVVREIARVMFEEHLGAIPIVDVAGALVGIITRSDILRALINRAPLELWV